MPAAASGQDKRTERLAMEDSLYEQALACVQQGRWAEAEQALAVLQSRYAGSRAVQEVQEALALHLSAERTWGQETRRQETRRKAAPKRLSLRMRLLVAANIALYMLVLLVWLLLQIKRLLG